VVQAPDAENPGGWAIVTSDGIDEHALRASTQRLAMRLGLVGSLVALALALSGLIAARHRRRRAETLGTLGLLLAWIPLAVSHDLGVGPWIGTLVLLATPLWFARWGSRAVGNALLTIAVLVNGGWLGLRVLDSPDLFTFDDLRLRLAVIGAALVGATAVGMTVPAIARRARALHEADVAATVAAVAVVLLVQLILAPPMIVPVVILVVSAVAYRRVRSALRDWINRAIFAEARERASIESAEAERARLSRELHDDPLQTLVGVILGLEERPGTEPAAATLRGVAQQLRHIATNLHPPVLDDLGLVPAVQNLFAESSPVPVMVELDNQTGFARAERPPFDVELAAYRIVQEAATNALRHSGCRRIVVRGRVSPERVAIEVVDDGRGIDDGELDGALRDGHLGVASMRRRAEAIDARLAHGGNAAGGTTVSLDWSR
jgi:signal transduction histidine kinase